MPGILDTVLPIAGAIGDIAQPISQALTNIGNRRFQMKMYERQRSDALSDWNMQNEYNSPASQMSRLKIAGLNPNLVYGHGADAVEAAPVRQSQPGGSNQQAPQFSGLGSSTIDAVIKTAQLNNIKMQNGLIAAQTQKAQADTFKAGTQSGLNSAQLDRLNLSKDVWIAQLEANLSNTGMKSNVMASQTGLNLMSLDRMRAFWPVDYATKEQNLTNMQQQHDIKAAYEDMANQKTIADVKLKAQQVISLAVQAAKTDQERSNLQLLRKNIESANDLMQIKKILLPIATGLGVLNQFF